MEESERDRAAAGVHTNIDLNGNVSALLSFQSAGAAQMHTCIILFMLFEPLFKLALFFFRNRRFNVKTFLVVTNTEKQLE